MREAFTAACVGDNEVYVFGGLGFGARLNDLFVCVGIDSGWEGEARASQDRRPARAVRGGRFGSAVGRMPNCVCVEMWECGRERGG
jgi:hypothetical protein